MRAAMSDEATEERTREDGAADGAAVPQHFRWNEDQVSERLGEIVRRAFYEVADRAKENGTPMRPAAYELGIERVVEAASTRGYI